MSALHQAALVGQTDIMSALLEGGAMVDIKDSKGKQKIEPITRWLKVNTTHD